MASSYEKRKRDIENLRKAVEQARRECATEADALALVVKVARSVPGGTDALLDLYKTVVRENHGDLSAAIESAMFGATPLLPASPVAKAVADSFTPKTTKATEPEPTPEEQARIEEMAQKMRKTGGEIREGSIPRVFR